jgi:geranylgeranyl diphosphate synthase type II
LAILAGDALLTDAFCIIAGEGISNLLVPEVVVEIIGDISRATGSQGMVGGQALDLAIEGKDVNVEFIEKVYTCKTGALIEASVISGARIGEATDDQLSQLRCYGKFLGLAFQIIDDILDIEGGTETGKNRGADARKNKATYPALVGVGEARRVAAVLTENSVFALKDFDERADTLRELSFYLGGRKY